MLTGMTIRPLLLHVHMPKTAGSALNLGVLAPRFKPARVWLSYGVKVERRRKHLAEEDPVDVDFIAGHLPYGFAAPLGRPVLHVSVLRDPVDRIVSFLNYVAVAERHGARRKFKTDMKAMARNDPSRFAKMILGQDHVRLRQSNTMVRLASGMARLSKRTPGLWRLGVALRRTASPDYLIGAQEAFDAFAAHLSARLDHDGIGSVPPPGAGDNSDEGAKRLENVVRKVDLTPAVIADIETLNALDRRFYDRVAEGWIAGRMAA